LNIRVGNVEFSGRAGYEYVYYKYFVMMATNKL